MRASPAPAPPSARGPDRGRPEHDRDGRPATSMRTHLCGELRTADVGTRCACAGGWPSGASTASTWPSSTCATTPGIVQCVVDGTRRRAQRVRARRRGTVRARPRAPSTPSWPPARSSSATARWRCWPRPSRRRSRSTTGPRSTSRCGCATATSTCAGRGCSATSACGPGSSRPCAPPWSARASARSRRRCCGRPPPRARASSPCRRGCHHGLVLRAAPEPADRQAAAHGRRASTATSRSPAACATRTCVPTGSSSSPSSTSRRRSSPRRTSMAFVSEAVLDATEAADGRAARRRSSGSPGPRPCDRFGTDKPDLRFGMELVDLTAVFAGTEVRAFARPVRRRRSWSRAAPPRPRRGSTPWSSGPRSSGPRGWPGSRSRRGTAPAARRPARQVPGATRSGPGSLRGDRGRAGRPGAGRGRRVPRRAPCSARCASTSGRRRWARARTATCGWSTSRCSTASTTTAIRGRPPPVHHAAPRRPRPAGDRPAGGAIPGLRPGAQRLGARVGSRPYPPRGHPARGLRRARASRPTRPRPASGSCSGPSATAPRPTGASRSASTGWWPSWPARRTSARSSPSRRPSRGPTP